MPSNELRISVAEHKSRIEKIRDRMRRGRVDALYLTNPTRILYTTGFSHISTERPLAVVIPLDSPIFFMGPRLEYEHIREECKLAEEVYVYPDYPGRTHPIRLFAKFMGQRGVSSGKIATDSMQGAAGGYGYLGPALRDVMSKARFVDGRYLVDEPRLVKSSQEIRLLRESAKWSEIGHDLLLEDLKPGMHDAVLAVRSSHGALIRMLKKLGSRYVQLKIGLSPMVVGFRGQIGKGSAIPHAVYTKNKIRRGDILVSEAGVEIGGYTSELERTIVVGKPTARARRYFEAMVKAQDAALKTFKHGRRVGNVDEAAARSIGQSGLSEAIRHHTGHGIGLDGHEPPWLDPGDRTVMKSGMVFSCEPGLYVPGYAGFRHSDTLAVTTKGIDMITHYPRSIEELTL